MKPLLHLLFSGLCLAAVSLPAADEKAPSATPVSLPSLDTLTDKETVDIFASMPVQEQGRVKPLETLARFRLLRFSGKQSGIAATDTGSTASGMGQPKPEPLTDAATGKPILTAEGKPRKFSAIEWLLVSWFRPDIGKNLRVLVVDNSDAVIELGLGGKGKRDRYSFNEIAPGRQMLVDKWNELRTKQTEARKEHRDVEMTPQERALSKLAVDFLDYEMMLGHFDFAGPLFAGTASSLPPELAALVKDGTVTNWASFLPALSAHLKDPSAGPPMQNPWMRDYVKAMLGAVMSGDEAAALHNFPPPVGKADAWHGPGDILQTAMTGGEVTREDVAQLTEYASLYKTARDPAAFKMQAKKLRDDAQALGNARGESGHVGLELHYYRTDYFYRALLCFTFGLLLLALSWVKRGAAWEKWTKLGSVLLLIIGAATSTTGIVIRCIIMQRPPITTLYETIIFITTACVIAGLLAELANRKGYALIMAAVAGTAGMFLSLRFFTFEGTDSMKQLEAVLITTFWLSTHVPCINLGYAMGMVASIFSMIYMVGRMTGRMKAGGDAVREVTRMAYGFVLAGLFFSLVGTVLGGIWANYSWGRFWGWDPKENGALMIVLMNLVILHARMGGYVREVGFHNLNLVLGMVTIFSWFATNQLGIGLHAYGAMDNAWSWLYRTWAFIGALLIFGLFRAFLDRRAKKHDTHGHTAAGAA
jgi:ABC-type transport system involved in cytochrome c biogenesis permease subunit